MDPEVTWRNLIAAIIDRDQDAANELAESLSAWLNRGGFSPKVLPGFGEVDRDSIQRIDRLDRMIVSFVCANVRTFV